MKKILLLGLLIPPISLMALEHNQSAWNAELYTKNHKPQKTAVLHFLNEIGDDFLKDKIVCDMGCGPGDMPLLMAQKAKQVFAFDSNQGMIDQAKKTCSSANGKVQCMTMSAEDFTWKNVCHSLTSFFVLRWIQDKQKVLTNFYTALKPGGRLVCTIATKEEKTVVLAQVVILLEQLRTQYPSLKAKTDSELTGRYIVGTTELEVMLKGCGFESIVITPKIINILYENQEDFVAWQRPIFMSIPLVKLIPEHDVESIFQKVMNDVWSKLERNSQGYSIYPFTVTFLTANKPKPHYE